MYDRAPREVSDTLVGSTPYNVGPGTYELPKTCKKEASNNGYAPFLSLATRNTIFNVPDKEIDDPGPGTYNPGQPQPHVKGGGTIASKERRFTDTEIIKENTPGPGRYNIKGMFNNKSSGDNTNIKLANIKTVTVENLNTAQTIGDDEKRDIGQSKSLGRKVTEEHQDVMVDMSITKSGRPQKILTAKLKSDINSAHIPSIPSPGQAHGYIEKTNDLGLKKQKGPKRDRTMGPAFYNPNHEETKATTKYKGCHFGSMTSNRTKFLGRGGPAPCDYETRSASWEKSKDKIGAMIGKNFESRLPRYHQIVQIDEKKRNVPGPGRYDIATQFQKGYMSEKEIEALTKRPAFGLQQTRFLENLQKTPSPGSYDDPRNALEALKKISGLKRSPFGQTSYRFKPTHSRSQMMNNTPGPGSYNILNYGMSADSRKKAKKAARLSGGFGTTSVRTKSMVERDTKDYPGPGMYELRNTFVMVGGNDKLPKSAAGGVTRGDTAPVDADAHRMNRETMNKHMTSSFASKTERLEAPTTRTKLENPPPGSYEVAFAYDKTQCAHSVSTSNPRNKQAFLRQRSFLSSAPRFGKMSVYYHENQLPVDPEITVSAASYTPKNKDKDKLALIASRDMRFKEIKANAPGPGTYHLSPLIDNTVLKGTYNVTLNNPVPHVVSNKKTRPPILPKAMGQNNRPMTSSGTVAVN